MRGQALLVLLGSMALSALVAIGGCGTTSNRSFGIPPALLREMRPIGAGPRFQPPVLGRAAGLCRRTLGPRFGVHVEVFGANRVLIIPAGIGTTAPRRFSYGRIVAARCYGPIVTLQPTGVVLARVGPAATVGELFSAWGQPLSRSRLASFAGRVRVYVGGRRPSGPPGRVPLTRHAEIVLEVGPYVPPHSAFAFPPGE
ncbi:MAG: hypothetical protein ACYDHH_02455 [Solirubrobacteraceae bacterium]